MVLCSGNLPNRVTTSLTPVGIPPAHLNFSSGRRLPLTVMPQFSTSKIRISVMMRKHVRLSSPNGQCGPPLAQGHWEGDAETFPETQEFGAMSISDEPTRGGKLWETSERRRSPAG
jgi:hypothetical protein